jgi:sucrose-6-phosphate hydrolase SacC (GH32 family)
LKTLYALVLCAAAFAQEPYRPLVHFSPQKNWTNDPNGPVYFEGEYHLFFQYNPFGDQWGHMSWGHAVSTDLLHWKELPVAIPEAGGVMIFSGSVVVDKTNSSGFCTGQNGCLVAIYTGHQEKLQTQNIAYSNDRGRTWTKYAKNPVLDLHMADFRDPNLLWHAASKRWIMAVSLPIERKVAFYGSRDLKRWDKLSEFGPAGSTEGIWECPDIVEIDGRMVLIVGVGKGAIAGGSGEQYFIGRFDGTRFVNDNPASLTLWLDYGKDCYCALTYNNAPKPTMIAWMDNWQYADKLPTHPWRGQMTIPRELSLRTFPEGVRLVQTPVPLPRGTRVTGDGDIPITTRASLIHATVDPKRRGEYGWRVLFPNGASAEIGYDSLRQEVFVDRTHAGDIGKDFPARTAAPLIVEGQLQLDILIDSNSIEVFADEGHVVLTNLVFGGVPQRLASFSRGGTQRPFPWELWPLK